MGRLLRRNVWIEAGISLFLMFFFIYFYSKFLSGQSKEHSDKEAHATY